jgi:TusA-related sulfurtransferase
MIIDARGLKHPQPLERIREYLRNNCRQPIELELLVDSSEYTRTITAFARMSKCKTEIENKGEYFTVKIKGDMCSCA